MDMYISDKEVTLHNFLQIKRKRGIVHVVIYLEFLVAQQGTVHSAPRRRSDRQYRTKLFNWYDASQQRNGRR